MRWLARGLIKFYQLCFSCLLPPSCRFEPSCSNYAVEAYRELGFFKATAKVAWRLLRCNPWHPGGHDPVLKETDHRLQTKGKGGTDG